MTNQELADKNAQTFTLKEVKAIVISQRDQDRAEMREIVGKLKQDIPKGKCLNLESHLFGSCLQCQKIAGYNTAINDVLSLLLGEPKQHEK